MFSLQKVFGKDDRFFDLLEASAEEARHSVQALNRVLSTPNAIPSLSEFHKSKEADKRITDHINEHLVTTFVFPTGARRHRGAERGALQNTQDS
jgi:hypothetical protein